MNIPLWGMKLQRSVINARRYAPMAQDLVCGMQVDEHQAQAQGLTTEFQGQTYYFCSKGCKKEFDKHPEQYVPSQSAQT
jgi:YHS domain-containing protein